MTPVVSVAVRCCGRARPAAAAARQPVRAPREADGRELPAVQPVRRSDDVNVRDRQHPTPVVAIRGIKDMAVPRVQSVDVVLDRQCPLAASVSVSPTCRNVTGSAQPSRPKRRISSATSPRSSSCVSTSGSTATEVRGWSAIVRPQLSRKGSSSMSTMKFTVTALAQIRPELRVAVCLHDSGGGAGGLAVSGSGESHRPSQMPPDQPELILPAAHRLRLPPARRGEPYEPLRSASGRGPQLQRRAPNRVPGGARGRSS